MNLKASLFISLAIILFVIFACGVAFSIFVDSWTIDNADRTDIVARGPFLAGIIVIPVLIITSILISVVTYFGCRKYIKTKYLLIGIFFALATLSVITLTGVLGIFFVPGYLLSRIIPYAHYGYYLLLLIISIYIISDKFRSKIQTIN